MARSTTKTDQRSNDPSTLAHSPFKAAKRAKRGLTNAGLGNVHEALRFHDLGARFANPFLAMGFFARLAARPFSGKEQEELEAEGRKLLLTLGVDEQAALDAFTGQEVVISLPIAHLDRLDQFHALGLRRTGLARARGYVELRGTCDVEAATRLVDEMGGTIFVISRPSAPEPAAAATPDGPKAPDTASAPDATEPSEGPADSNTLTDLPVETRSSKAPTSADASAASGPADEARKEEQFASAPSNAPAPQPAVAAPSAKAEIGHAPHGLKPSDPENEGKANPDKKNVDEVDERDLPPFMRHAWQDKKFRRELKTLSEQTIDRPILRRIMPPGGEKPRT
jgi:hypothetical protein